ncbi:MAG: hypothetical protein LVR00_09395 [Rhabdochlamydiaceae bacterium]|jgi:hypothetical protein
MAEPVHRAHFGSVTHSTSGKAPDVLRHAAIWVALYVKEHPLLTTAEEKSLILQMLGEETQKVVDNYWQKLQRDLPDPAILFGRVRDTYDLTLEGAKALHIF